MSLIGSKLQSALKRLKISHLGNATPLPHPLRVTPQTSVASLVIRIICGPALVPVLRIIHGLETQMEIDACVLRMLSFFYDEGRPISNEIKC